MEKFKILEEAEYMEDIINERQNEINQIDKIMNDVKEIAQDYAVEVDEQGEKLAEIDTDMQNVAMNAHEATRQLKQADKRSRKNGRCLLIIAIIVL